MALQDDIRKLEEQQRALAGNPIAGQFAGALNDRLSSMRRRLQEQQQAQKLEQGTKGIIGAEQERLAGVRGQIGAFQKRLAERPGPTLLGAAQRRTAQVDPRFEQARIKAEQRGRASAQTAQDALKRRLAASGQLSSGAGIKLLQQQQEAGERGVQEAIRETEAQKAAATQQEQSRLDDQFARESLAREQFNAQAQFQDRIQRSGAEQALLGLQAQLGAGLPAQQLAVLQQQQAQDESNFNKRMERWKIANSGGLFGGGGFLGLGLGTPGFEDV